MSIITVTRLVWELGERKEIPYPIDKNDLEIIDETNDGCWLYTKESTWDKYDGGKGIETKESLEELEKLAGYLGNLVRSKRKLKQNDYDYDDYNEYGSEPSYDEEERWERLSEEGIYED
ncbi:hypothetical protein [Cytobacillus firmus]|uniref:hypothetical protein n=1 Tax=Cytobacillus firmus TaxID=1399 RepID=UPI001C8EC99A|nr:hypothetical protein [Cytobacillus firmus]MBX9972548.1 hypothetical protein [Cytobacillus firmus]